MQYLARKIRTADWPDHSVEGLDQLSSDALTSLQTFDGSRLSVWVCTEEGDSTNDIALALASSQNRIGKIVLVLLEAEALIGDLTVLETEGACPAITDSKLPARHRDICVEHASNLCSLALRFADCYIKDSKIVEFTQGQVKTIIRNAIANNRLDKTKLSLELQKTFP